MSRESMTWEAVPQRGYDDVLLPLDLVELAQKRPKAAASVAEWATWLFRKAHLLDRVAANDTEVQEEMTDAANEARRAALTLQRGLARRLAAELLTHHEGQPVREEDIRELLEQADGSSAARGVGFGVGVTR